MISCRMNEIAVIVEFFEMIARGNNAIINNKHNAVIVFMRNDANELHEYYNQL